MVGGYTTLDLDLILPQTSGDIPHPNTIHMSRSQEQGSILGTLDSISIDSAYRLLELAHTDPKAPNPLSTISISFTFTLKKPIVYEKSIQKRPVSQYNVLSKYRARYRANAMKI